MEIAKCEMVPGEWDRHLGVQTWKEASSCLVLQAEDQIGYGHTFLFDFLFILRH